MLEIMFILPAEAAALISSLRAAIRKPLCPAVRLVLNRVEVAVVIVVVLLLVNIGVTALNKCVMLSLKGQFTLKSTFFVHHSHTKAYDE